MQPDSNYRDELLRVQQIANPDFKSRVMSTLAGTSDLGLPGKAGSEYKPQTVYELMNKYSPPALIAKGIGKAYEASPDAVKKNVGEFAEDIGKAYQTARNMSPVIRGTEAVLTAAPKMPEGYIGGSPMDNPMANMETGPGMPIGKSNKGMHPIQSEILKANSVGLNNPESFYSYYTPSYQIAYELGLNGVDLSKQPTVRGYRYGKPPELGISWNFADNRSERGLSLAALEGTDEPPSTIWFRDRKKYPVEGMLLPYTGSDGEPLILYYGIDDLDNPNFSHGGHVSLDDLHAKYAEGGRVMADELARV